MTQVKIVTFNMQMSKDVAEQQIAVLLNQGWEISKAGGGDSTGFVIMIKQSQAPAGRR